MKIPAHFLCNLKKVQLPVKYGNIRCIAVSIQIKQSQRQAIERAWLVKIKEVDPTCL